MSRRNAIAEPLVVTLTLLLLLLIFQAHPAWKGLGRAGEIVIPLFCLLVPWAILTARSESFLEFGLHLQDFPKALAAGLLASLLLLGPYFLAFSLWTGKPAALTPTWPAAFRWLKLCVVQIFYVALPEECFFRGYLQTRLNQMMGRPFRLLGASMGWGLWITAFLFMVLHLLYSVNIWTVGILVPALVFGWLREKTGSVTAPTVFHALSNILLFTLQGRF